MLSRVAQSAPSRVTKPTYEKLQAQLGVLDKKISAKAGELKAHKEVMMRSRHTPEGLKTATAKLKKLEKELAGLQTQRQQLVKELSVLRPALKAPSAAKLTAAIERHLKTNDLDFSSKAPKKEDILTQTEVNKRPFSYTAIVLKSDPTKVIIKKVLTGGFVPARPGDGVFSKPVSIN